MKIELVTFLEAIDHKIALLNHNDLLTAEVSKFLFFPKGDKAKYGNKDFKNRLRTSHQASNPMGVMIGNM